MQVWGGRGWEGGVGGAWSCGVWERMLKEGRGGVLGWAGVGGEGLGSRAAWPRRRLKRLLHLPPPSPSLASVVPPSDLPHASLRSQFKRYRAPATHSTCGDRFPGGRRGEARLGGVETPGMGA